MSRERDPSQGDDATDRRAQRRRISLQEFQRRLAEAEGDPEAVTELVREMVKGVIEEVRELAEADGGS